MSETERLELVILSPKSTAARCRVLGERAEWMLRVESAWRLVPGEIATVRVRKRWRHGRTDYVSGVVERTRLDVKALGLVPLGMSSRRVWRPAEWLDEVRGDEAPGWWRDVLASAPRPSAEMEQVLPGIEPDDLDADPIIEASELVEAGDLAAGRKVLGALLEVDLRCLDAHAHLGNFMFDFSAPQAVRHYAVGLAIGGLSLDDEALVLSWDQHDNRPFLRCWYGYGLALWKLGRVDEARAAFERLLWLNPEDHQGARFALAKILAEAPWSAD